MVIVQPQIELYKTHISLLTEVWVPTIFYLTLLFTFFPTAHVGDFPPGRNDLKCDREEGLRYINAPERFHLMFKSHSRHDDIYPRCSERPDTFPLTSNAPPRLIGTQLKKKKTYFSSECDCCDERVSRRAGRQAGGAGDARANKRVWAFLQQHVPERSWSWMSLPCDPEDCGECVSVTLIKSNAAAVGTCGQVNETQREADSSASPSPPGSCGRRDEVERLPSPTGRADTLFKAPLPKYGCIRSCTLLHKSSTSCT